MILLLVVLAVVVAIVVGVVAGLVVRAAPARADAEREALIAAATRALAAERSATVQAAVDTAVSVAGRSLTDHTSAASNELDLRRSALDRQHDQLVGELGRVRELVATLQKEQAEQQGRLELGLEAAARSQGALADSTQSLREALANPKARGQWGERMADDVLRAAGFVEGVNYRRQTAVAGGGIPDVTFLLPQDRVLHMDVKFPLDNYLRSIEAPTEAERAGFEAQFVRDVRARVKELTTRAYIDADRTVDAVLLFIPNESIYAFIHDRDPDLLDLALGHKVVLCSPVTLFAVLAVVRQAVDNVVLARTGDEILQCLSGFEGQWVKFSDHLDNLGKRFESAQRAYDDLAGTRRRALQRELDRVDDLRVRRGLPAVEPTDDGGEAPLLRTVSS